MAEDEFFKRIAEAEPTSGAVASDKPTGTAARRGLSAKASTSIQSGLEDSEQIAEEEHAAQQLDEGNGGGQFGSSRRTTRQGFLPSWEGIRLAWVAAAGVACVVVAIVIAGTSGSEAVPKFPVQVVRGETLSVVGEVRTIRGAFALARAARGAERRRIARETRGPHEIKVAPRTNAAQTVPAAPPSSLPVTTRERFSIERPMP